MTLERVHSANPETAEGGVTGSGRIVTFME